MLGGFGFPERLLNFLQCVHVSCVHVLQRMLVAIPVRGCARIERPFCAAIGHLEQML